MRIESDSPEKINKVFVLLCIVALAGSVGFAIMAQPYIHSNEQAQDIIITFFSIFAGFLVAIITFVGEQTFKSESWRMTEARRARIKRQLDRHKFLFWLYMLVIGLIFSASLLSRYDQINGGDCSRQTVIGAASKHVGTSIPVASESSLLVSASNSPSLAASPSLPLNSNLPKKSCLGGICVYFEYFYLTVAAFAFIYSLYLPHQFMSLQLERIDKEIDEKQKEPDTEN